MKRACFALRNGIMPRITDARSNSPRPRISSAHAAKAAASYTIWVITKSAPASSFPSSLAGS